MQESLIKRNSGQASKISDEVHNENPRKAQVRKKKNSIPKSITDNKELSSAISYLPSNYNFEIHKTMWKIQQSRDATTSTNITPPSKLIVALQFPEGLLMYSLVIADIFRNFCGVDVIVLGDVTYGACCVDDYTAKKLGAHLLVHYGHSCLVPVNVTNISVMYVFVEIYFDPSHLLQCLHSLAKHEPETLVNTASTHLRHRKIALLGTVQFISILQLAEERLREEGSSIFESVSIPQARPLSLGETLGCTAPVINDADCFVFVADGRFHLEAAMIRNPHLTAYRYDPYSKVITLEQYDTEAMKINRLRSIKDSQKCNNFGLILGTLGRQGSLSRFSHLRNLLQQSGKKLIPFLMAELNPAKLNAVPREKIQVWVQVACPRLSIDWSSSFDRPVLTPYELEVALDHKLWVDVYPMDYYASGGYG